MSLISNWRWILDLSSLSDITWIILLLRLFIGQKLSQTQFHERMGRLLPNWQSPKEQRATELENLGSNFVHHLEILFDGYEF